MKKEKHTRVDEQTVIPPERATASTDGADSSDVSEQPDPEMAGIGEKECGATRDGYVCTRRIGHANEHRGHGTAGTVLHAWGYGLTDDINTDMLAALKELHALVRGECPSLLNEDSGGDARLDLSVRAVIAKAEGRG
jgi:hypothetical protein